MTQGNQAYQETKGRRERRSLEQILILVFLVPLIIFLPDSTVVLVLISVYSWIIIVLSVTCFNRDSEVCQDALGVQAWMEKRLGLNQVI